MNPKISNEKYNFGNVVKEKDLLNRLKIPFKLTLTNYTARISSEIETRKFLSKLSSNQFFAAAAKIKSDVSKFVPPDIDKKEIKFYHANTSLPFQAYENVMNVDINSAYAQAMVNEGYISEETFSYLSRLPKMDRLGAIGMLASKKEHFYFEGGELINNETEVSPLENFFWFCCQKIQRVMFEIQQATQQEFIFSWVDGCYFLDPSSINFKKVQEALTEMGYFSKVEKLSNFEIIEVNNTIKYSYYPENPKPGKPPKFIQIPKPETGLKAQIANSILKSILKKQY